MVVNFRNCGINRGARKLARTSTLIKKIKSQAQQSLLIIFISLPFSIQSKVNLFPPIPFSAKRRKNSPPSPFSAENNFPRQNVREAYYYT